MSWTKIKSGFKVSKSAFSAVLLVLLSVLSSLFSSLPVNALNLNVSMTGYYESSDSSNVCWQYSFISTNYTCGQYVGHAQPSNGYADGVWRVRDSANSGYTLKANSISQVYVWFIGGSLEQSYSSGASFRLLTSEIVGTVGDRTEYVFTLLNTSATQNAHIQFGTSWRTGTGGSVFAYVSNVVTFSPDGYVDHDYTSLLNVLSQNVANQSQILTDIRNMTNDTNLRLDQVITNTSGIAGLSTALGDIESNTSATNDKLDRQWNQEQQDRSDYEDAQTDSQDSASDATDETQTATANLTTIIGSLVSDIKDTPASNCQLPVNDMGANGVLDLGTLDLCQLPTEFRNTITIITSIVVTLACFWLSYSLLRTIIDFLESMSTASAMSGKGGV